MITQDKSTEKRDIFPTQCSEDNIFFVKSWCWGFNFNHFKKKNLIHGNCLSLFFFSGTSKDMQLEIINGCMVVCLAAVDVHWTLQILRIFSGEGACVNSKIQVRGFTVSADLLCLASLYKESDVRTQQELVVDCASNARQIFFSKMKRQPKRKQYLQVKSDDTHIENTDFKRVFGDKSRHRWLWVINTWLS